MGADRFDARWLRGRLGIVGRSQSDLARLLGVHRSAISQLLKGKRAIKAVEISEVARFLEVSEAELMQRAGVSTRWSGGPGEGDDAGQPVGEGFSEVKQTEFQPAASQTESSAQSKGKTPNRHPAWGALKGMITLLPDVDYTAPADPDWGKVYEE